MSLTKAMRLGFNSILNLTKYGFSCTPYSKSLVPSSSIPLCDKLSDFSLYLLARSCDRNATLFEVTPHFWRSKSTIVCCFERASHKRCMLYWSILLSCSWRVYRDWVFARPSLK